MEDDTAYLEVQARLPAAWQPDASKSPDHRVVIVMPSLSLGPALQAHYAHRVPALEHRDLYCVLLLSNPSCRVVYLSSRRAPESYVDYLISLLPDVDIADAQRRLLLLSVDDESSRSLATKLLERPDVQARIRDFVGSDPAVIEPCNVTVAERDVAVALGIPLHGSPPWLLERGTKSGSRRMFAKSAVPCPAGVDNVRSLRDIARAVTTLRRTDPALSAVVVKLDDSASGDGNAVLDLTGLPGCGTVDELTSLGSRLSALPGWYLPAVETEGAVVEAWVQGEDCRSPSVQLTATPDGQVSVISTHDQILGGESGQVYQGCRFPAHEGYAGQIADYGLRVGRKLAAEGVVGHFGVDFITVRTRSGWQSSALEVNLRKSGTSHPFGTAQLLLSGVYDARAGIYRDDRGEPRFYVSTDNLRDLRWMSLDPSEVIRRVDVAGLAYDRSRRTGVVVHMLAGLQIDGRFGATAFGATRQQAEELYEAVPAALG